MQISIENAHSLQKFAFQNSRSVFRNHMFSTKFSGKIKCVQKLVRILLSDLQRETTQVLHASIVVPYS